MLDRADSPVNLGRLTAPAGASPAAFPAWARAEKPLENEAEAAFLAGAALARLDAVIRSNPPFAGALRRRLVLQAAAVCVARSGRVEDEAALRDSLALTKPGADPGPAGRMLLAWRALTVSSAERWRSAVVSAAEALQVPRDDALRAAIEGAETALVGGRSAPFAAAQAFRHARRAPGATAGRRDGEGALLAAWLADAVLAQKLSWPFAMPLLAPSLFAGAGHRMGEDVTEREPSTRVLTAYAIAAAKACDLAGELGRRAQRLQAIAPKLRAKGADAAIAALLDEDCLNAGTRIPKLSERGARRLFERLAALGAVRELTGRATFRLYGL